MKKFAIAAAGLSLLGLGACVSPAYAPYHGEEGSHDHADGAYYVHPNGNCVVPSAVVGGLAGLAAYALADEVLDWAGPINRDELLLSGIVGAGVGGLLGAPCHCRRCGG